MMEIGIGISLAFVAILLVLLVRSFYRVEEGHAAILTRFGEVLPGIKEPGLHARWPWEKVHEFSVMERTLPIREGNREVELLARDGTLLRLDPQVRFRFSPEAAETIVFHLKHPTSHLRELFRSLISAEIANFGTSDSAEGAYAQIRRNRHLLQVQFQDENQKERLARKYGISFKAMELSEILPPADLAQALNSVQKVEAENETLMDRIRAECEQRIASAKHGVQIAELKARAVETEVTILGDTVSEMRENGLLKFYLQRRRDEVTAMSKTLYLKT